VLFVGIVNINYKEVSPDSFGKGGIQVLSNISLRWFRKEVGRISYDQKFLPNRSMRFLVVKSDEKLFMPTKSESHTSK
jgi:hypothetical protein